MLVKGELSALLTDCCLPIVRPAMLAQAGCRG